MNIHLLFESVFSVPGKTGQDGRHSGSVSVHHRSVLQFKGLFIIIMGDGVAIALSYYSDIRLSKWTLINRTGGAGGETTMILNSTVLPTDCAGKAAMHFILLFQVLWQ